MKSSPITPLLLGLLVLSGCGGNGGDGDASNPRVLYLALDGSETRVKLSDAEPVPF